jgi:hypothetical protein
MKKLLSLFILSIFIISCDSEDLADVQVSNINGVFQKGPYLSGTKIDLYELSEDLVQTGKTFTTNITDNKGNYSFNNIELSSKLIQLDGLGYYYNEVLGGNSESQLMLSAYHEIEESSTANVNILTSLEKQRVSHLMSQGVDFGSAKKQALSEILSNFNIDEDLDTRSEYLNLSSSGNGNAILLAISSIIQGFRSDAEVNEIISNMATDLKEDGVINSEITGSKLLSQAIFLDSSTIAENLSNKYNEMGDNIEIYDFGSYLSSFIDNSEFEKNHLPVSYPETGDTFWKLNILHPETTNFDVYACDCEQSLFADFKVDGGLKIKISASDTFSEQSECFGWGYGVGTNVNIMTSAPTSWTDQYKEQFFETPKETKNLSAKLDMSFDPGTYQIDYYELGSKEPTRTKTLVVTLDNPEINVCFK